MWAVISWWKDSSQSSTPAAFLWGLTGDSHTREGAERARLALTSATLAARLQAQHFRCFATRYVSGSSSLLWGQKLFGAA